MRDRFYFTTFRWANQLGEDGGYAKRPLMRKGFSYTGFACGTDTPEQWRPFNPDTAPIQIGLICSPQTGLLVIDVDDPVAFAGTHTAQLAGRDCSMSTRGAGFHVGVDMRGILPARWPRQGPFQGGDIKVAGFVPVPSSYHYSGEQYVPRWDACGLPFLIPATDELLAALRADRAAGPAHTGGTGGHGGGHDGRVAGQVLSWVMRGLSEGECYENWLLIAIPVRSDWPFTDADFRRHYQGAVRKAARRIEEEAAWWASCLQGVKA